MRLLKTTKDNERYWRERKLNWEAAYFTPLHPHRDLIMMILKSQPPRSVLEIGCAAGSNLYRIKKEFPDCRVCGCDLNEDAIKTANEIFRKEWPAKHFEKPAIDSVSDIDFRVGGITAIPFHGEYFDMVITDACLIYVGPDKIKRAMRELRRVGYDKFLFCEFHSDKWWKRLGLRLAANYYAYNYFKLLSDNHFKHLQLTKVTEDYWKGEPWKSFGWIMTCVR